MNQLIDTWSRLPEEEDIMTEEHAWIWREMIRAAVTGDLSDTKVLDIGCNQGGFLRMLHDTVPFRHAVGIDLAKDRVALAEASKGERPIDYVAGTRLSEAGTGFDIAFSHEVIYLIEDLADHARQVAEVLKPGGAYYAVTCCHRDAPLWPSWREKIQGFSNLPVPDHSVEDIAGAFRAAGFEVAVNRFLANAFIPLDEPGEYCPTDLSTIETYTNWKLMFRCTPFGQV
ncbi:MAG: class I SAM-dependent methyltransferase [Pseudomonadota bacterium]